MHKAAYDKAGVKQWAAWSEYQREDPYKTWRKRLGSPYYVVDVDQREIRVSPDGVATTVAYIELECCPDDEIRAPLAYLRSFWNEPPMRLKLDSLVRDAQKLKVPAFFVCHTANLQQFVVISLPWNGKRYKVYTAAQYRQWLMWLNVGPHDRATLRYISGQQPFLEEEKTA